MKSGFLNIDLLRIHQLIKRKQTGTPQDLAEKFNCSVSTIYEKLRVLKEDEGLPVCYDKVRCTYYYDGEVDIDYSLKLDGKAMKKITGGTSNANNKYQEYLYTPKKSESYNIPLYMKTKLKKLFS